jgi:hypothetical protein
MSRPQDLSLGIKRSRRNLIKAGAIAGSAIFARAMTASAATTSISPTPSNRCFLKGTRIRTADGDRKIEDLAVGDLLPTHFGGIQAIQWIGRYSWKRSDPTKSWVRDVLPVRVARSALGPEVPHTDLYVTGAHALFITGHPHSSVQFNKRLDHCDL